MPHSHACCHAPPVLTLPVLHCAGMLRCAVLCLSCSDLVDVPDLHPHQHMIHRLAGLEDKARRSLMHRWAGCITACCLTCLCYLRRVSAGLLCHAGRLSMPPMEATCQAMGQPWMDCIHS